MQMSLRSQSSNSMQAPNTLLYFQSIVPTSFCLVFAQNFVSAILKSKKTMTKGEAGRGGFWLRHDKIYPGLFLLPHIHTVAVNWQ